jgi:PAS domain S-box-containing protein
MQPEHAMLEKPRMTILVVDDSEGSRYTMGRMLQTAQYQVKEAATGADALRLAEEKPDLIILDVNLPDINGREVCRRLKANPSTAMIPVLHLSASFVDSENRAEGLESGADGYLTYPVERRELVANIEALLRARRAERAAREQRELLRITLHSIGDGVIATDTQGRVTFLNEVAQSLTGWTQEKAIGQALGTVFRIVSQETHLPGDDLVARALREGRVIGLANHTLLIAQDGTERAIEDSAAPIRDEAGVVVGVILVFRDVSEKQRSELMIQDARAYAESIVDTVREPLLVLTGDFHVASASRSFYQTFQTTPAQTQGQLLYELGDGLWDIPALRRLLEQTLVHETSFHNFEVEHVFPTIGHKIMLLNARKINREVNRTEFILLAIEDITERRHAELGLRESEERFRLLVEGVADHAIMLLDPDGRVVSWNEGVGRILGYVEEEILGQSAAVFFPLEDRQAGRFENELQQARTTGRAGDDLWLVRKDGKRFWASGANTALHDANGRLRGFIKILRDLTERKELEETLRERAEQLAEADRHKDEFLAMLAHELRNPLAPIRNALQTERLADPSPKPGVQEAREIMERQVEHLVRLVDDLLDVSRISRGKIQLHKERIDLATVLARAIEGSRPIIDGRNHVLELVLPNEMLLVEADPVRLAQVFLNLLTNAAKYTPEGGRIQLLAEVVLASALPHSGGDEQQEVVVRVRDTGVGIPAEMLAQVFDLFTQVDPTLDRTEGGLGIGLTLVRRLTEMHGGRVEAFSAGPGRGSEFVVRLPLAAREMPSGVPKTPAGGAARRRLVHRRILVVDDNRDAAESLAVLLRLLGHDVRTAYDGRLALETAAGYDPNVILLDIGLPGLDGFEVCQRLRASPDRAKAVIIAMTGYGQEEDKRHSQKAGFDAHLVKPVDLGALQDVLARPELIGPERH